MKHDNKPLTLEELREMVGQPVWIEYIAHPEEGEWRLFKYKMDNFMFFSDMEHELCSFYYITWLAYAQKPINLDDWTAEWKEVVTHNGCTPDYDCVCSKCGASGVPNDDFCSSCGRAMSDKARELLERRLTHEHNE